MGLAEIAGVFLKLGCLSFGGPVAHLGYFRAELVEKRGWLDDAHYGDLVALCQFLPGPASSQVVFALGMHRGGFWGALLASFCFTLPSALLMLGLAAGLGALGEPSTAGWLHGLKLAAVAVVAQAVWGMGKKLCPDRARIGLCLLAAAILLTLPSAFTQVGVIILGGLVGVRLYRDQHLPAVSPSAAHPWALAALATFFALLLSLPLLAATADNLHLSVFDSFYRSGALVFGGGHVVLPLLREEIVPRGWLTDDQFLAGYGAAQALPGPMFAFSAYLGAAMPNQGWQNGLLSLFGIFLPAWLLIGGALPFWHRLRGQPWAQAALSGANAAVVGVLLAALYHPVFTSAVHNPQDMAAALITFGLLEHGKIPPWLGVLGMAAAGQFILAAF